jgi:hypothetical protein
MQEISMTQSFSCYLLNVGFLLGLFFVLKMEAKFSSETSGCLQIFRSYKRMDFNRR